MRYSRLAGLAVAVALAVPGLALAQPPKVDITGIRIGYTGSVHRAAGGGKNTGPTRYKTGAWAPVYVDLQIGNERIDANSYELVVETTDADDMQNVYVERRFLPTLEPREQPTLLAYVRPGNTGSEITVTVRSVLTGMSLKQKKLTTADLYPMQPNTYGYLSIGGPLRSLFVALLPRVQNNPMGGMGGGVMDKGGGGPAQPNDELDIEENGNRTFAHLDVVAQMPTYWFGYQPADTVILLT